MVVAEEANSSSEADDCRRGLARLVASGGVVGGDGGLEVTALAVNSGTWWGAPKEEVAVENLPTYLMGAVLAWAVLVAAADFDCIERAAPRGVTAV